MSDIPDPEQLNPDCLQLSIGGIGRLIKGTLVLDLGPGGAIPLMPREVLEPWIKQYHLDPAGQRILLRIAFVDFVPTR